MLIGKLAGETGVNIETIRYYERVGLLAAPPRTQGRHRVYDDHHAQRLTFIRRSRELRPWAAREFRGHWFMGRLVKWTQRTYSNDVAERYCISVHEDLRGAAAISPRSGV